MDDDLYEDSPPYKPASSIDVNSLKGALCDLALLGNDHFLGMQAFNIAIVDEWLTQLEEDLLHKSIDEERTLAPEAMFLSAQSQMWIFATYELLRTWRQRAKDILKWAKTHMLTNKLEELKRNPIPKNFSHEIRIRQIEIVLNDQSRWIREINDDLWRTYMAFSWLEAIRISLAKHEVRSQKNSIARVPGYGRINQWCGAVDYEIELGNQRVEVINRRDIADDLREIQTADIPTEQELKDFDKFMSGPPDIELISQV